MTFVDQLPLQLKQEILRISKQSEDAYKVFEQLYAHLTSEEGSNKRRKLGLGNANNYDDDDYYQIESIDPNTIIFQLKELSFQSPLRKKLNLTFSISPISQQPIISISKSNDSKPDLIIDELSKENIYFSTFLPVPEKKQQLYFVLFYKENINGAFNNEPLVLTLNQDLVRKQLVGEKLIKEDGDFTEYIKRQAQVSGFQISESFNGSFNSFFVQAHKGTKEGTLYFLPNHILFGFKKPILLFHASDIDSISYSSITRITFNVTLVLQTGEKHEFSMIDQSDFASIDDYIKNRQVLDKSMSEELKAKKLTKNPDATGALAEASQQFSENAPLELAGNGEEDDSDDEEADANFQGNGEIDDTSDVSSDDEDDDETRGPYDDEEDEEEEEEDEDEEIELNSDDD